MENLLWCLCGILIIIIAILCIRLHLMKKSADEIRLAMADRLTADTNTLIDISSRDRHMRKLAADINVQLRILRRERHRYLQGDLELKEAVTNISHDLRTPLTAICGYLDLLEQEEASPNVRRYLSMIANRTEVLKSLTEELFRYSVINSTTEISKEPVSLGQVLEESLASYYGALTKRSITPEISITEKTVRRCLDRCALTRIFANILSNAMKYSDGDLSVSMDDRGTIIFSNSAKNLDAVAVGRLFDRFYTVENARNSTGLGLSIAKLLTERMGGNIQAHYRDQRLYLTLSFPAEE